MSDLPYHLRPGAKQRRVVCAGENSLMTPSTPTDPAIAAAREVNASDWTRLHHSVAQERVAAIIRDHYRPLLEAARDALKAAESHLDYTGYGDSWERECAAAAKLPETIADSLTQLTAVLEGEPKGD